MLRKLAAILLTVMLLAGTAYAEVAYEVEPSYEGEWLTFEDDGFQIFMPSDWTEVEVTEDVLATGIYYISADPTGQLIMSVQYIESGEGYTFESLQSDLEGLGYKDIQGVTFNGVYFLTYEASDEISGAACMTEDGYAYNFIFYCLPENIANFGQIPVEIMASFTAV